MFQCALSESGGGGIAMLILIAIISALPDVIERQLTEDHEFILLACDGIWDVMTNNEVLRFVRSRIAQRMDPKKVSRRLHAAHSCTACNRL